jgi:hypothetical protein
LIKLHELDRTYGQRNADSGWSGVDNVVGIVISGKHFVNRDTGAQGGSRKGRQHHDKLNAIIQGLKKQHKH